MPEEELMPDDNKLSEKAAQLLADWDARSAERRSRADAEVYARIVEMDMLLETPVQPPAITAGVPGPAAEYRPDGDPNDPGADPNVVPAADPLPPKAGRPVPPQRFGTVGTPEGFKIR
jgi:hypothetical protein